MANIVKRDNATKYINEGNMEHMLPFNTTFAIADTVRNHVVLQSLSTGKQIADIPYDDIDDKFGTSNAAELVDYYEANGFFFQVSDFDPTDIEQRLEVLEQNIYEVTYKEPIDISASTNGSISFPTGATLDETEITGNAVLSLTSSGEVLWETPQDGANNPITAVLAANGNWVVTNTTSDEVALVFRLRIAAVDLDNLDNDKVIDKFTNDVGIDDKQDRVPTAVEDNIATWNSTGNTKDSGVPVTDISDNASDINDLETDVSNLQTDVTNLENTKLDSVQGGTDISVDNSDPLNPIINYDGASGGEANTSSNLGAGEGLAQPKVGVDLPFKSLVAGTNINLSSTSNEITIESTASGGGGGGTTAGIINRNYFTGDTTVLPSGTYYDVLPNDRGTVASDSQTLALNDNQKGFYAQDFIGPLTSQDSVIPKGTYTGQLVCQAAGGNGGEQEWTVEVYLTDADGNVISSGISGAPVGDLGVEVITILQTGEVDIQNNNPTQLQIGGEVLEDLNVPINSRARYHISAEKIGAAGGLLNFSIFFGSDYESYIDVPNTRNTCIESMHIGAIDGTQTSANTLYAIRTLVYYDMKIANLGTIISSAGAGTITLGIYDDSANKDLIAQVDIVSPSNGDVSENTGQVDEIIAGTYVWLAIKENSGSVTFFKTTTFTDSDICLSQFYGPAGLPPDLSGAFASNVAPYVNVCS